MKKSLKIFPFKLLALLCVLGLVLGVIFYKYRGLYPSEHLTTATGPFGMRESSTAEKPPLYFAALNGDTEKTKSILKTISKKDLQQTFDGDSYLHLCAKECHTETCRLFLNFGLKPDLINTDKATPLHYAASCNGIILVSMFLEATPESLNLKNNFDDTALHSAALAGAVDVVKLLAVKGAALEAKNTWGMTAAHYAAARDKVEVLKALSALGADLKAKSNDGTTPLSLARSKEFKASEEYLKSVQ